MLVLMSAAFVSKKDIERLSVLNYCIKHKHLNNLFLRSYSGDHLLLRIEEYRHDISCRNIGPAIFQDKSRKISDSRDISAILAINRRFFPIYCMVNAGQRKSNVLQYSQCATMPLQCPPICLLPRGFEP